MAVQAVDTIMGEATVRLTEAETGAVEARPSPRPRQSPTPSSEPGGLNGILVVFTMVLAVAAVFVAMDRPSPRVAACEPITYTLLGSPPDHARAEFAVAVEEIRQRSGIVFVEGGPRSTLKVTWSDDGVTSSTSPHVADSGEQRLLGFGGARWLTGAGGREVVDAVIEVDATFAWPLGLQRGDGLAAVFVHELGHVLGLQHSPEMTSFMHHLVDPGPRQWTTSDLEQLESWGCLGTSQRSPGATVR